MNDLNAPEPQRSASRTALGVALLRAVHHTLDGEPKILDDPISRLLLDKDWLPKIEAAPGQANEALVLGVRSHVVLRSRFAEDRMAEAVRRGVSQSVVLGAGYDTFAYRQPDWARSLRIYEVDHRASQEEKRGRLEKAGIAIPENLEFVAIDFESASLREGLGMSSLDFARPTFFSCLGVLVYLTQEAVDAVFQLIASFPAGSEIAFTFSSEAAAVSDLAERARSLGEPWLTHFDPQTQMRDLQALGFSEVAVLSPDEADRRYYRNRSDGLSAPRRASIAAAIVGGVESRS